MSSFGAGFPQDGNNDKGYQLFLAATIFIVLSGIFVALRVFFRWHQRNVGPDDLTILASWCNSVVLTVLMNLAVANGYGIHKALLTNDEITTSLMWFFIAQIFYKIVILLTKTSLILLYLRIFIHKGFRRACFIVLGIVVAWSIASILTTMLQCIPIRAAWDKSVKNARCINSDASWYQYGIINILTDIMIFALPVREVLHLQLNKREKRGILFVFLIGAFVCVVSLARVVVVGNSTQNKADQTGNFVPRSSLTLVEANVGIICACLPMLQQPLAMIFPRIFASSHNRSYELSGPSIPQFAYPGVENHTTASANPKPALNVDDAASQEASSVSIGENRKAKSLSEESDEELLAGGQRPPRSPRIESSSRAITVSRAYEVRRT